MRGNDRKRKVLLIEDPSSLLGHFYGYFHLVS